MSRALAELRQRLGEGDVVVVVGAGLSMAATKGAATASWRGLIADGLEHSVEFGHPRLSRKFCDIVKQLLEGQEVDLLLAAASIIESRLEAPSGAEWRRWLLETVGRHEVLDEELITEIYKLNVPILTTNYDNLLLHAPERREVAAVSWMHPSKWVDILKGRSKGILHLHGWCEEPESVILGVKSYEAVLRQDAAQEIQRALGRFNTFVFVGFGMGVDDPNLGLLIDWLGRSDTPNHRHYILLLASEARNFESRGSLYPISYGPTHEFLVPFFRDLRKSQTVSFPVASSRDAVEVIADSGEFCESQEGLVPTMIVIPAGEYTMGTLASGRVASEELPAHRVTLNYRFAVSKWPVSFREWDEFERDVGGVLHPRDAGWGRGQRPVINVSWFDVQRYLAWINNLEGIEGTYRLLSEAEWEYVARAGTTTNYWWGDDIVPARANYDEAGHGQTTAVGAYPPSPFGLCDTAGNVWEWVQDPYHPSYEGAPTDGSVWEEGGEKRRVVRGGCWYYDFRYLRSAARLAIDPEVRFNSVGFRIARTIRQAIQESGSYAIISVNSGLAVTNRKKGAIQERWKLLPSQVWRFVRATDESLYYYIQAIDHSGVLTVLRPTTLNSSRIAVRRPELKESQFWILLAEGDGYVIQNLASRKVLDVDGISRKEGAGIIQFSRHGNANQRWWVRPVEH